MKIGDYVLRNAVTADIQNVLHFCEATRNDNNASRRDEQLIETVEDRKLLIVLDKYTNAIEAISGTFRYHDGEYVEVGATFVSPPLRGFQLQLINLWNQTLAEEILDPDFTRFFAVVKKENHRSLKNLKSAGFVVKRPNAVIEDLKQLDGKLYLELSRSCRYQHARNLLDAAGAPSRLFSDN